MKKMQISNRVYNQYIATVKENEGTSKDQAALKFTRNAQLAVASPRKDGSVHYKYGCLHFIVAHNSVVWMQNNSKMPKGWKRNNKLYLQLNRELEINEDVTMFDLVMRDLKSEMRYKMTKLKWKIKLAFQSQTV